MIRPPDHRKSFLAQDEKFPVKASGDERPGDPSLETGEPDGESLPVAPEDELTAEGGEAAETMAVPLTPRGTRITLPGAAGWTAKRENEAESEPPEEMLPFRPWNPAPEGQRFLPLRLVVLIALGCLVAGWLGGSLWRKPPDTASGVGAPGRLPSDDPALTRADQDNLDAAYVARKTGKFAEAAQLFAGLQRRHPNWGSMDIELGRTQLSQQDWTGGQAALKAATDKGLLPADGHFNLALLAGMQKDYHEAETHFEAAVTLDPTRPDFYYFWGECLRNEGKPVEAAGKFRSALLRNQYETNEGLYRLKLWLSEIEAERGDHDTSNQQIAALLAQPRPPMEVLFLAAARDLKAGDFRLAAEGLVRARQFVEPNVFRVVLGDPVFAQESWRPELAELFKSVSPTPLLKTDKGAGVPAGAGGAPGVAPVSAAPVPTEPEKGP